MYCETHCYPMPIITDSSNNQSLGFVCAFVWGPLLSFQIKLIIVGAVLNLAVLCLMLLDCCVSSLHQPTPKNIDIQ